MANLTNAQTELLKYLHSQIGEAQTSLNRSTSDVAYWTKCKSELSYDDAFHTICDFETNKARNNVESLNLRFKWLVEQMNEFVPEELK